MPGTTAAKSVHSLRDDKNPTKYKSKLNKFYRIVKDQLLKYQHPISGLFPLRPEDPNCKVSHVRDSIYCATAVWALHQCYHKVDDDEGRTYELGQCAVKCMRAILTGWMQQCSRLEQFKKVQSAETCLHVILDYETAEPNQSNDYHHLQMDCVGLYVLQLVQMIMSGLQVIYTKAEVCFVQNLVFYLERAYRIPDYGIWTRGSKQNNHVTELHASSIGMAKAALEVISGFNLFGCEGDHSTVIFVDVDAHSRNRIIMSNLLPRESASKGSDSSLISTLSWPAFATHTAALRELTLGRVTTRFEGAHGFKRFSRDGYRSILEERPIYEPGELKKFQEIENEWPMFFAYMTIESCFRQNWEKAEEYNQKMETVLEKPTGEKLPWLPAFFYVPEDCIAKEREHPGTTKRVSSFHLKDAPKFLWGQSVYIISQLMLSGLLSPHDLDPYTKYVPADERPVHNTSRNLTLMKQHRGRPLNLVIQVVLISESVRLQQMLATYGIQTQTPHQVEPIQIWPPDQLAKVGQYMGCSEKMGLSGRPPRPVGQLGTSKFYRMSGITVLCYPLLFEVQDFYLLHDMKVVIDECKSGFTFLANWWRMKGRPTVCMLIKEDMIKGPDHDALITFLSSMKTGKVDGVRVLLGRAQNFVASGCVEHLDFMQSRAQLISTFTRVRQLDVSRSFRSLTDINKIVRADAVEEGFSPLCSSMCPEDFDILCKSVDGMSSEDLSDMAHLVESLHKQSQILYVLMKRHGVKHLMVRGEETTVGDRLAFVCRKAGVQQSWAVVRFCSALLGKFVNSLAPSLSAILVCGKQVTIGVAHRPGETSISKPLNPDELRCLLSRAVFEHDPIQMVLQQELILWVGSLITRDKRLFRGIAVVRMGWLVEAMKLELYHQGREKHELYGMSPTEVKALLEGTLSRGRGTASPRTAFWTRQLDGCLARVPNNFYACVYQILSRSPKGLSICGQVMYQDPILQDMTPTDLNFVDEVERLLQPIDDPCYRSVVVEAVMVVAIILDRNKELHFEEMVEIRNIIEVAVAEYHRDQLRRRDVDIESDHHEQFYAMAPNIRLGTTSYLAKSAVNLLLQSDMNLEMVEKEACVIS